jgi:Ca-activated chloride channel family protein
MSASFKILLFSTMSVGLLLAAFNARAENPDELYRQGRFAEAAEAYARSDMDHPKNIRFRYNKGCAEFQNSDYEKSISTFSSVLRRAESDEIKFKASYNLGNTAFKLKDFNSAADFFKLALTYDLLNEDARINLELALRELKSQEEKKQEDGDQSTDSKSKEKDGESQKEDRQKSDSDSKEQKHSKQEAEKSDSSEGEKADKGDSNTSDSEPQDLSGELRGQEEQSPNQSEEDDSSEPKATISRKMAEALLDNIKEDRSKLMRFLAPRDKDNGPGSGKDW